MKHWLGWAGGLALLLVAGGSWWLWPRPTAREQLDTALATFLAAEPDALTYLRLPEAIDLNPRFHFEWSPPGGVRGPRLLTAANALAAVDTTALDLAGRQDWQQAQAWVGRQYQLGLRHEEVFALNPFSGLHLSQPKLLITAHVVKTRDDVEAYLRRLEALPEELRQGRATTAQQAEAELPPPARLCRRSAGQLRAWSALPVQAQPLYQGLARRLVAMDATEINDYQATDYLIRAADLLEQQLIPAWAETAHWLDSLADAHPTPNAGRSVKAYPDWVSYFGDEELVVDSLHREALTEVSTWQAALAAWQQEASASWRELSSEALRARLHAPDTLGPEALTEGLRGALRRARQQVAGLFDSLPAQQSLRIRWLDGDMVPQAAGYVPAAWDGKREAQLLLPLDSLRRPRSWELPLLAYQWGYPGTHLRAQWRDPQATAWRYWGQAPGAEAAWQAYALHLVAEDLMLFPPGSEARLGYICYRLQEALLLAAETGYYTQGWTLAETEAYFMQEGGYPPPEAARSVDRLLAQPGVAVASFAGRRQYLRARAAAETAARDMFYLQPFNTELLILQQPSVPLRHD
ncbi:MAG: DUF885 family protein [Bacteroidetes bacterium]|nr:MAG: DUF885 family protein [Bacteroidota bacterium]